MATTQDYSSLFKEVYGNGPVNLLPSANKFQKLFPFAKGEMVGNEFVENLDLEFEHGFTYAGPTDVAPTLAGAVAAENSQAKVSPYQIIGQKIVGYRDITRTDGAGKKAFTSAVNKRITDLMRGTRRNIEISMMHGQSTNGLGVVAANASGQNITLTAATTSPGIWAGAKNMKLDIVANDYTTLHATGVSVGSVDPSNPDLMTITLVGTISSVVAGDIVYRAGALSSGVYKECPGVATILRNSGSLFNIDASQHSLWKANSLAVGGRLTMKAILQGVDLAVSKGLDGDVICFIPVRAYAPLNDDQSSLRVYDESYNKKLAENGFQAIAFWGQTGKIIIVPHLYMMQGEAWILPYDDASSPEDRPVKRIGSTDVTFGMPGAQGGTESADIFVQSATTAAVEIRNFTDQAPFIVKPGWCTLLTGITYT